MYGTIHSAQLSAQVEKELQTLELPEAPADLYGPIKYAIESGGKRLRPVLLLLSCGLFTDSTKDGMHPALAVEMFHNFTLLHDDIMDRAPLRRNRPSVFKKWNADIALLAGDVMMVMAYGQLLQSPKKSQQQIISVFNEAAISVCEGQQLDMEFETRLASKEEYMQMIALKTASLIAACMAMGALAGGASSQQVKQIKMAGRHIGVAFQLQDDLLDVFGIGSETGKITGGDILAAKTNWPLLIALERATQSQCRQLSDLLKDETLDPAIKVEQVISIYKALHVECHAKREYERQYRNGMNLLARLDADRTRKKILMDYIAALAERTK